MKPNSRTMRLVAVTLITLIRLPLAAGTAYAVLNHNWPVAAVLILVGILTDLVDGPLARRWSVTTEFGHHLDSLLDRILLVSPLCGAAVAHDIPIWILILLVVGVYVADAISQKVELMRMLWWPLIYVVIASQLILHTSLHQGLFLIGLLTIGLLAITIVKRSELKRIAAKFLRRSQRTQSV